MANNNVLFPNIGQYWSNAENLEVNIQYPAQNDRPLSAYVMYVCRIQGQEASWGHRGPYTMLTVDEHRRDSPTLFDKHSESNEAGVYQSIPMLSINL